MLWKLLNGDSYFQTATGVTDCSKRMINGIMAKVRLSHELQGVGQNVLCNWISFIHQMRVSYNKNNCLMTLKNNSHNHDDSIRVALLRMKHPLSAKGRSASPRAVSERLLGQHCSVMVSCSA